MKAIKTLACALVALAVSASAFAQSNFTKTYETAGPANNWFVSAGGGISAVLEGIRSGSNVGAVTPGFEVSFGKWVTPTVGGRFGYAGIKNKAYDEKFWNNYIHMDVLWNLSNQFWGYKSDRIYNAIPYLHTGVYAGGRVGREFAVGAGLLNNFRINDRFIIFADLRGSVMNGEQVLGAGLAGIITASVGLTVNLGKKITFNADEQASDNGLLDEVKKALAEAKKAAEDAKKEAAAANDAADAAKKDAAAAQDEADKANAAKKAAEDELEALKNKPQDIIEKVTNHIIAGPLTVYFELGKSTLNQMEQQHLSYYLDNLVKGDQKDDVTFVLTGSADKSTGSAEINERLCNARVEYVKDVLVNKYGVDESKITVKENVYSDDTEHPEFSRAVIIEH